MFFASASIVSLDRVFLLRKLRERGSRMHAVRLRFHPNVGHKGVPYDTSKYTRKAGATPSLTQAYCRVRRRAPEREGGSQSIAAHLFAGEVLLVFVVPSPVSSRQGIDFSPLGGSDGNVKKCAKRQISGDTKRNYSLRPRVMYGVPPIPPFPFSPLPAGRAGGQRGKRVCGAPL